MYWRRKEFLQGIHREQTAWYMIESHGQGYNRDGSKVLRIRVLRERSNKAWVMGCRKRGGSLKDLALG